MYDYLLGGTDNFAVDREAADHAFAAYPGGFETARIHARAQREFLGRAVRYLIGEGIRQFLDIGTGVPNADNAHGVAQAAAPESRVVYVDNDPMVLAHAHSLVKSTAEGATAYIDGDLRDPAGILDHAASTLDFSQPVAVMLVGILHLIPDDDDPDGIVARLLDAVIPGSALVVAHLAKDIQADEMAEMADRANQAMQDTLVLRTHDGVARFLDGVELVDPGVVRVDQWRPDETTTPVARDILPAPVYGAVGRKT
jgi:hypothetical protein